MKITFSKCVRRRVSSQARHTPTSTPASSTPKVGRLSMFCHAFHLVAARTATPDNPASTQHTTNNSPASGEGLHAGRVHQTQRRLPQQCTRSYPTNQQRQRLLIVIIVGCQHSTLIISTRSETPNENCCSFFQPAQLFLNDDERRTETRSEK